MWSMDNLPCVFVFVQEHGDFGVLQDNAARVAAAGCGSASEDVFLPQELALVETQKLNLAVWDRVLERIYQVK